MAKEHLIDWDKYIVYENGDVFSKYKNDYFENTLGNDDYVANSYRMIDGTYKRCRRNRVVWTYFNGDIPDGYHIDHIDTNKLNNSLINLRCVTPKENMNNPLTMEHNPKYWLGKHLSEEHKKKLSDAKKGNKCHLGKKHSEEAKKKMSEAKKGKYNTKMSKPINQYDLDGLFIKTWPSLSEIQRELGYSFQNISKCCQGQYKQMYGYIWEYA